MNSRPKCEKRRTECGRPTPGEKCRHARTPYTYTYTHTYTLSPQVETDWNRCRWRCAQLRGELENTRRRRGFVILARDLRSLFIDQCASAHTFLASFVLVGGYIYFRVTFSCFLPLRFSFLLSLSVCRFVYLFFKQSRPAFKS